MTIKLNDITTLPAIACHLQGGYLIEASAGTGKTWTLTGIILRLLIEKQYPPERIIATTFTRAAATELQERVQSRLNEFYQYLSWLNGVKQEFAHWFVPDVFEKEQMGNDIIAEILSHAEQYGIVAYDDPVNIHLIVYLLSNKDAHAIQIAIRRISLLLATLDKLFIGTLDSLAQKWLKEFASEISYQADTQISTDSDALTRSLIHDALRREHFVMLESSPKVYQLIGTEIFSDIDGVLKAVNLSLQFYTAPIDETDVIDDNFFKAIGIDVWVGKFLSLDLSVFEPFYDLNYAKNYGLSANLSFTKNFALLKDIIKKIKYYKSDYFFYLTDNEHNWIEKLLDINHPSKLFKKGFEEQKEKFYQLPIDYLLQLYQQIQKIKKIKQRYKSYLYRKISLQTREKLKTQLESMGQSTFTFQMVRLIEALEANTSLARHIRYLYPVMLIDESQDINGLQFDLIELIYLKYLKERKDKNRQARRFLLLVGDPKQAIYRFRGGDVANYNLVKNYGREKDKTSVLNCSLSLTVNRRSNMELISALNQWFDNQHKEIANYNNHAYLGDDIYYQSISAANSQQKLSWQNTNNHQLPDYLNHKTVSILSLDNNDSDDFELIAKHINSVLQSKYTIIDDNGICRAICPMDIAILSRDHKSLASVKEKLNQLNISAISPKDINIFTTQAAKDLYALLSLIMDGVNQEKMGAVLTSSLFGMNISQSMDIVQNHANLFIVYLKFARELFYKYGVASCLTYCFQNNPFKQLENLSLFNQETLWQQVAKKGERYLTDIWQLTELIIRQDGLTHNNHEIYLLSWLKLMIEGKDNQDDYKQMILPSETGVNLMTIHKAKGLEFPIVYILGLEKAPKDSYDIFYPYSDDNHQRRLSANAGNADDESYFKNKNYQEEIDEARRLGYVALTRASEQVFVVAKGLVKKDRLQDRPLYLWFENNDKTLSLPDRLIDDVGWINLADCQNLIDKHYQDKQKQSHQFDYLLWKNVFSIKDFYGTYTTSATALMNQYENTTYQNKDDGETFLADIDVFNGSIITKIAYPKNDIRQNFEKGVHAGTFLHQLLQFINPNDKKDISHQIDHLIKSLGFNKMYLSSNINVANLEIGKKNNHDLLQKNHQGLIEWIWQIVQQPMMSSGISLSKLSYGNCIKEMGFTIGLDADFNIDKLNQVFAKFSDKKIIIDNTNSDMYYQFLRGEMDLVYEHQGKFYVVDYKSNYISHDLSDYHQENLEIAMQKLGYWLQACIYQVALHRLLKIRIKDYTGNEQKYLGSVEFVFLRGIDRHHSNLGRISWQIPMGLIFAMDKLFGDDYGF